MVPYQYTVVVILLLIVAIVGCYYAFLVASRKHRDAKDGVIPAFGYSQWLEEDARDKFPKRGECELYDFGADKATLRDDVLDQMQSRHYSSYENCTDSNQLYAAKVNRVCKLYVRGSQSVINHCYLPGNEDTPSLNQGYPRGPVEVDSLYRITLYSKGGKLSNLGRYAIITHKASGRTLSPGSNSPNSFWRIAGRKPNLDEDRIAPGGLLIYIGKPNPEQWKVLPEADLHFIKIAMTLKLKMAVPESSGKELIMMNVDPKVEHAEVTIRYLSFSLP